MQMTSLNKIPGKAGEEETVSISRAIDSFKELFEKMLPTEVFTTLKKKVE